jgi:hypothetical protein
MRTLDRQQIAADWARRGFGWDLWTDPPGRRWEDFTHATDELALLNSMAFVQLVTIPVHESPGGG